MKLNLLFLALMLFPCFAQTPAEEPQLPRRADNIGIQVAPDKYLWLSDYSGKTCVLAFIRKRQSNRIYA